MTDDRVDERGTLLAPDDLERAPESGAYLRGIGDRALRVPAERAREHREIRSRVVELLTNARVLLRRAAVRRHAALMLPVGVGRPVAVAAHHAADEVVRGG